MNPSNIWALINENKITVALLVLSTIILDPLSLVTHFYNSFDFYYFSEDARPLISPYLKNWDKTLSDSDYLSEYFISSILPKAYTLLMEFVSNIIDPRIFSKFLSLFLYLITGILFILSALKLGGWYAAWGSALLFFSTNAIFVYLEGGFPRSFAGPILALTTLGLISGRPAYLATATLIGSLFYYISAAFAGLSLFTYLILFPSSWHGASAQWSFKKRVIVVGVIGTISTALIASSIFGAVNSAPMVGPNDFEAFPEAGPGGRHIPEIYSVFQSTVKWSLAVFLWSEPLSKAVFDFLITNFWVIFVLCYSILVTGLVLLSKQNRIRRLIILPVLSILLFQAAILATPYLYIPSRYMAYTMPIVFALLFPVCFLETLRLIGSKYLNAKSLRLFMVGGCLALVAAMGGRSEESGLMHVPAAERPIYDFVSSLPTDVLIAGWPKGILDNIPYLTGRKAFLTYETHSAFHADYILEMRRRMKLIINAYHAENAEPLMKLRKQYGVTHFVIDETFFENGLPKYFKPFNEIAEEFAARAKGTPYLRQVIKSSAVYRLQNIVIIDLRALKETSNNQSG